jgi:hypothetical protein
MVARTYRVKISKAGEEFEFEGDKAFVLAMLKKYELPVGTGSSGSPKAKEKEVAISQAQKGKALSIREFVQQLGVKKHTDITLAFGFYLERYADTPEFTPADINNCYYEAKIEGSNTSQMIIQNIKRGFFMLAKGTTEKAKKRYTLTSKGEKYVEERLAGGS